MNEHIADVCGYYSTVRECHKLATQSEKGQYICQPLHAPEMCYRTFHNVEYAHFAIGQMQKLAKLSCTENYGTVRCRRCRRCRALAIPASDKFKRNL